MRQRRFIPNSVTFETETYGAFLYMNAIMDGKHIAKIVIKTFNGKLWIASLYRHRNGNDVKGLGMILIQKALLYLISNNMARPGDEIGLEAAGLHCGPHKFDVIWSEQQWNINNLPLDEIRRRIDTILRVNSRYRTFRYQQRNEVDGQDPWDDDEDGELLSRNWNFGDQLEYADAHDDVDELRHLLCALLNQQRLVSFYERCGFRMVGRLFGLQGFPSSTRMISTVRQVLAATNRAGS